MTGLAALRRPAGRLGAPPGLGGRPLLAARLPAVSARRARGALRCRAHKGHGAEHSESHAHSCCSHGHSHEHHAHSHGCGQDHGGPDLSNPAHRLLAAAFDATRLTPAAAWLESSVPASIGKVALFLIAAGAAGWASSGWAASAAAAATARAVSTAATAGVYLLAGLPAAVDLSFDLTAGKIDTHVLMNLAVLGTLATGHALEGALLLVLFQSSHVVEHLLTERAQGNLAALYDSMPKAAVLVQLGPDGGPDLGSTRRVLATEVAVGQLMLVKPGEQVPLDGQIVHGRAMVSSEHITGESLPVLRRSGDEVAAGSLNRDGVLVLRALRLAEESTPARIARLTLDAQAKRPQLRTWLDQFGEVYSKAVVGAAVAVLAGLLATGVPLLGAAGQRGAFYRAMGLLTVASPCALVMVPLAYVSAIAAIASRGILVKGGRVLDALVGCSTVAFDKTGTLTTGSLSCTSMRALHAPGSGGGNGAAGQAGSSQNGADSKDAKRAALGAAVALSLRSNHPVSDAVVLHGQQKGEDGSSMEVSDFQLVAGGGVQGTVRSAGGRRPVWGSHRAIFGSLDFVSDRLSAAEVAAVEQMAAEQGTSRVLSVMVLEPEASSGSGSTNGGSTNGSTSGSSRAAMQQRSTWVLSFEDSIRKQSSAAVRELQTGSWTGSSSFANRLTVTMLTGDNERSAQRIARKLGIANVKAALSPEQKLAHVQQLSGRGQDSATPAAAAEQQQQGGQQQQEQHACEHHDHHHDHDHHDHQHEHTPACSSNGSHSRHSSSSRRSSSSSRSSSRGRRGSGAGGGVIMVGDGINDAPALAAADVGVAIASSATTAASLAADVVVVNSSGIAAVPFLLRVARATQAVIRQNLALAIGGIVALALPTMLGWVPLWFAVMLHEGSTLLVALNSLRLLAFGAPPRQWQQPAAAGKVDAATAAEAAEADELGGEQGVPAAVAA